MKSKRAEEYIEDNVHDAASDFALSEGWEITDDGKCYCPECANELNLQ